MWGGSWPNCGYAGSACRTWLIGVRFIQYYQILEYSAFYWTEESVRTAVKRVLMNPDLHARLDYYVPRVIDALTPTRAADEHKIRRVVETTVDPALIWAELNRDIGSFCKRVQFDGGFICESLLATDTTEESFKTMWAPKLTDLLRSIRNALVHGRESRLQVVIAPTAANEKRLRSWMPILRRVAEQVIICSSQQGSEW